LREIKFHKDFKLNGNSFSNENDILSYAKENEDSATYNFLCNWFSKSATLPVNTSGSTGVPKIIFLEKEFMINSAKTTGDYFKLKENTSALLCLPTQYIAGKMMLVRALTLGWHIDTVLSSLNPLEDIEKSYDFLAMVPLQLENSLLKINKFKKIIIGGGVVSSQLEDKLQNYKAAIFATYGMTETITHIAVKLLNRKKNAPNFFKILPNINIYKDQRNCLVIEAPLLSRDLIITNDVVDLISDTEFNWLGRFDNVINSGGVKLHPEIIEKKLSNSIESRYFITSVKDEKLGEKLVLLIEGEKKEIDFNKTELSKFEVPKNVYFIQKFEETETGKIQRKKSLTKIFNNK
jgi:o-succinylbenzoate---CoA ligase